MGTWGFPQSLRRRALRGQWAICCRRLVGQEPPVFDGSVARDVTTSISKSLCQNRNVPQ